MIVCSSTSSCHFSGETNLSFGISIDFAANYESFGISVDFCLVDAISLLLSAILLPVKSFVAPAVFESLFLKKS